MKDTEASVTPAALAALLRKYRLLARWRRAKDSSVTKGADTAEGASPAAMRALAEEFPGALRELDLLGLPELERRVACLEAAVVSSGDRGAPRGHDESARERDRSGRERQDAGERLPEDGSRADDLPGGSNGRSDVAGETGGEREPWIPWIASYHALMRVALASRRPSPAAATPSPLADAIFLRDVHRPPGGRLSAAVLEALGRHFQRPPGELRRVLFPPRR